MHKIDIQLATDTPNNGAYDVLVNGDHYMRYATRAEAERGAIEAGAGEDGVIVRRFIAPTLDDGALASLYYGSADSAERTYLANEAVRRGIIL